ncbi:MAG: hypothetical protein CMM16_02810 [Rhodospirillaceae bacterium]|nr:hypothetical protein [Rhodospirillaceae bacterium]|tara:strand:- start:123 stop:563 length:441 start_codon:yes stop_codon:yes gene_type:complete
MPQCRHDLAIYQLRVKDPDNLDVRSGVLMGLTRVVVKYLAVYRLRFWETRSSLKPELWVDVGMFSLMHWPLPYMYTSRVMAVVAYRADMPYIFMYRQTGKLIEQGLYQNQVFERVAGRHFTIEDKLRLGEPVSPAGNVVGLLKCAA